MIMHIAYSYNAILRAGITDQELIPSVRYLLASSLANERHETESWQTSCDQAQQFFGLLPGLPLDILFGNSLQQL
jgi:hypothetical protein